MVQMDGYTYEAEFNVRHWQEKVVEAARLFQVLEHYVSDPQAVSAYLEAEPAHIPRELSQREDLAAAYKDLLHKETRELIASAANLYRQHMIVVAVSLLDEIIEDFFSRYFPNNPSQMDNFLRRQSQLQSQSGEAKFKPPSVELKDLIACRQMERAFEERGRKCATDIASSHDKMQWVFQEIVGRTPRGIKGSAIKDLTELRNSIVHRRDQESKAVSTSEVGQAFTALFELVEDLGTIAVEEHFSYVEWPESVTREINRLRIMMDQ